MTPAAEVVAAGSVVEVPVEDETTTVEAEGVLPRLVPAGVGTEVIELSSSSSSALTY